MIVGNHTQQTVIQYIRAGLALIPLPAGHKNPGRDGWQDLRIAEEDVPHYWNNGQNVGLLTGTPSGGIVDVDLDSEEAVRIAGRFLPLTLTSSRKERPHSHWWFKAPGAKSRDWKDTEGKKLVELRSDGRQTLVAPSLHPSGDQYVWHSESSLEMAEVDPTKLEEACRKLATALLLARHLPPLRDEKTGQGGGRHDYAMALGGFLLRTGRLDEETTLKLLGAAWDAKGWPDERSEREAHRDLEGIVRDTAENLRAGEPVTGGPTLEEIAPGVVKLLFRWWGWGREVSEPEEEERPTQAQLLTRSANGARLFHTPAGDAYAIVSVDGHRETHPIRSKSFKSWLRRGYYDDYGKPPGAQALQDALGVLEAKAQFDGSEHPVCIRVAEHEGAIYVDLANERWEAVKITPEGWCVVSDPPVRFRRPRSMLPLPSPAKGGTAEQLRRFINLGDEGEASWHLLLAWLVQASRPTGPYPVLTLQGEQGSAKSTVERMLRALIDPSVAPLRTTPRNEHDLMIAATNSWVVAFDNISNLQPWLSDALCRLSTGGGFGTRTLYENDEETLFDAMRPVILNGITDVATRPDLLDRALIVTLPPIPEEKRKSEADLWFEFEKQRPTILGALFDAVSHALRSIENVQLEGMPRMADFAVWATAAEGSFGWEEGSFMEAYTGNREEANEQALEADPVAGAVRKFMENRDEWTGTASDLWRELGALVDEEVKRSKAWPGAPNALTNRLRRLAPALRKVGIEYSEDREGRKGTRNKTLRKTPVKDRQPRQHRQPEEEVLQNEGFSADDAADGLFPADDGERHTDGNEDAYRQQEIPANEYLTDGADDADDGLQSHSKLASLLTARPDWLRSQARKCLVEGKPKRLLKPLASTIAAEYLGDVRHWCEALSFVEENLEDLA